MTKTDQEILQELGRDIGQRVFAVTFPDGRVGVIIGALETADADRAYMCLRGLEKLDELYRDEGEPWGAQ